MSTSDRLFLTIKKKYFELILSGKKTEEYREIKKYYINKFTNKTYKQIILQSGYSKNAPKLIADIEYIKVENRQFDLFNFDVYVIKLSNAKIYNNTTN